MSTFTVTSTADGGDGSLRDELELANAAAGDNTIVFDSGVFAAAQTISLTGGPLELSNTTGTETIVGPAAGLTITAGGSGQVFLVDPNAKASLSGLTITGGSVSGPGGGLMNNRHRHADRLHHHRQHRRERRRRLHRPIRIDLPLWLRRHRQRRHRQTAAASTTRAR